MALPTRPDQTSPALFAGPIASATPKRTLDDVASLGEAVVAYVAKIPGASDERFNKALGVATRDLQLPIMRSVAAKKLETTGRRRGTEQLGGVGVLRDSRLPVA